MPNGQTLEQVTRVPVGLSAYLIPQHIPEGTSIHSSGALTDLSPEGSVFSRYRIGSSQAAASLHILDMQFKPFQGTVSRLAVECQAVPAPSLTELSKRLVYAIQWQVSMAVPHAHSCEAAATHRAGMITEDLTRTSLLMKASKASAASQVLRYLQKLPPKAAVQLQTRSALGSRDSGPCSCAAQPSAVAAAGLMRVAAQETPSARFQHLDVAAASIYSPSDASLSSLDGILDQGQQLQPLLTQSLPSSRLALPVISHSSGVVISGGMGDVGAAVASWVSTENAAGQIWLLGRSGRGNLSTALKLAGCCMTVMAGDTAAAADMANPQHWLSNRVLPAVCPQSKQKLVYVRLYKSDK